MHTETKKNAESIRIRHVKRQKQRNRMMKRRRIIFFTVLGLIVISVVLFFTPLFNIKNVSVTGNQRVDTVQIKQVVGSVEEDNLFILNEKKIIKNIKTIPYVDEASIKKKIFPVGINVKIIECVPVGYILYNNSYVVIDKNMKVLEISENAMEGIAEISGILISAANEGAVLTVDDADKLNAIIECFTTFYENEMISKIGKISFDDIDNITFNYENRLDVLCGSTLDFSKKIGMFQKAVTSSKLTENSRGTIDISVSGKAIYTP